MKTLIHWIVYHYHARLTPPDEDPLFGPVIHAYTRRQAIDDGVLVDASQGDLGEISRQFFKHDVAMTAAVWTIIEKAVKNEKHCNDYNGVWHDVMWMAFLVAKKRPDADTILFRVIITGAGRRKYWTFKLVSGPDDDGQPCLTLMMPEED